MPNVSWNPNSDGLPNEQYRWYKNHRVSVYSDPDATRWKFQIDYKDSKDFFPDDEAAKKAVYETLDTDEFFKSGYSM